MNKDHYHDSVCHVVTGVGQELYELFKARKSHKALVLAIQHTERFPIYKREAPINCAHLLTLLLVDIEPGITVTKLLPSFEHNKQSLRSRLQFLERKGLLDRQPKVNYGGNNNPNTYSTTQQGHSLIVELV